MAAAVETRANKLARHGDLFFRSDVQTYLQRDVRDLAQVGSEAAFLRFVKACAGRTGQFLHYSDLARDTEVRVNTAQSWLSILQASFQVMLLQPYHTHVTKRLIKSPKLDFLDTGMCAYLTDWTSPETFEAEAMAGAILETSVFTELLKSSWHRGRPPRVYCYRNKDGDEIDFLFVQDRRLYPVEVRKTASPRPDMLKAFDGLQRIKMPMENGAVLCLCQETLPLSPKVQAVPIGLE